MSPRLRIATMGALGGAAIIGLPLGVLGSGRELAGAAPRPRPSVSAAAPVVVAPRARTPASPPTAPVSIAQVVRAFTASYAAFLDGSLPAARLRYVSLTARGQALAGGPIPASFRDGPLRVRAIAGDGASAYSAQATIELANREESYPFTVLLLRDQRGWRIAQLQPPDLSIDEPTPPLAPVRIPPGAQRAARLFAVAYTDYRAGVRSHVTGLTSIALGQLRTDEDGLAQTPLPRARRPPRRRSLRAAPERARRRHCDRNRRRPAGAVQLPDDPHPAGLAMRGVPVGAGRGSTAARSTTTPKEGR